MRIELKYIYETILNKSTTIEHGVEYLVSWTDPYFGDYGVYRALDLVQYYKNARAK